MKERDRESFVVSNTYHSLINRRTNPVVVLAMQHHLRDLESGEIGKTQLDEFASLVHLVDLLQRFGEVRAAVCGVQVEDVDTVRVQLSEGLVEFLLNDRGGVSARLTGVPFGREGEAAFLPFGIAGPGFLFATDVDSCGVNFVVARGLELVEDSVVVFQTGDSGTG